MQNQRMRVSYFEILRMQRIVGENDESCTLVVLETITFFKIGIKLVLTSSVVLGCRVEPSLEETNNFVKLDSSRRGNSKEHR